MSLKTIIFVSIGAMLAAIMLFLGFKGFKDTATSPDNFQYLAQVSQSTNNQYLTNELIANEEEKIVGTVDDTPRVIANNANGGSNNAKETAPVFCAFQTTKTPIRSNVIINEAAWMGTSANSNYEWVELKNISGVDVDISNWQLIDKKEQIQVLIPAKTKFRANSLYLLERNEEAVPDISANQIYSGALSNSDEGLRLFDANCQLIDEVLAAPSWPAGDSGEKRTMERGSDLTWHTYSGTGENNIFGTPLRENSLPAQINADNNTQMNADNEQASNNPPPAENPPVNNSPPEPEPTSTPEPAPKLASEHVFYTSSHWKAKYYYCDSDSDWKNLSPTYLKSFSSEQELLLNYSRVLHEPCQD